MKTVLAYAGSQIYRSSAFQLSLLVLIALAANSQAAEDLSSLPFQKNYTQERVSSTDASGGNDTANGKIPLNPASSAPSRS